MKWCMARSWKRHSISAAAGRLRPGQVAQVPLFSCFIQLPKVAAARWVIRGNLPGSSTALEARNEHPRSDGWEERQTCQPVISEGAGKESRVPGVENKRRWSLDAANPSIFPQHASEGSKGWQEQKCELKTAAGQLVTEIFVSCTTTRTDGCFYAELGEALLG